MQPYHFGDHSGKHDIEGDKSVVSGCRHRTRADGDPAPGLRTIPGSEASVRFHLDLRHRCPRTAALPASRRRHGSRSRRRRCRLASGRRSRFAPGTPRSKRGGRHKSQHVWRRRNLRQTRKGKKAASAAPARRFAATPRSPYKARTGGSGQRQERLVTRTKAENLHPAMTKDAGTHLLIWFGFRMPSTCSRDPTHSLSNS